MSCLESLRALSVNEDPSRAAHRRTRQHIAKALVTGYTPWSVETERGCLGQRAFMRSDASIRVVVAGRQAGKTHAAAEEVVRLCLARPGADSCLLMPNYKSSQGAKKHLDRALLPLGGSVRWQEAKQCYVFPNRAKLYIRTAVDASDRKAGVPTRGLTLDGVFWIDEASFIPRKAWEAALATLSAVKDPRVIITTTPKGRGSWVFRLCQDSRSDDGIGFFRFRTTDSPHHNPRFVARMRRTLGRKTADEELNAVFVGGSSQPFQPEDVAAAVARGKGKRLRGSRLTLGLDLAKAHDFTCLVLVNEFQEAWLIDRFRAERDAKGNLDPRFWATAQPRVLKHAKHFSAIVCVDVARGGGVGEGMADFLTGELGEEWVRRVKTGNPRLKAKLVEQLIADFEVGALTIGDHEGLRLTKDADTQHLLDELTHFPPAEMVEKGGIPEKVYAGPMQEEKYINEEGEEVELHDDTVLALSLARWGSVFAWDGFEDPLQGDFGTFLEQSSGGAGSKVGPGWGESLGSYTI